MAGKHVLASLFNVPVERVRPFFLTIPFYWLF